MDHKSPYPRSRQKSCIACAKGKRRCDRQTPQCSRCASQGVQCIFVKRKSAPQGQNETDLQSINADIVVDASDLSSLCLSIQSSVSDYYMGTIDPALFTFSSLVPVVETLYPDNVFLDRWSVDQLVRNIKGYPRMFVRFRETPFIHPHLYETRLPEAIQDAFTISAAYLTKSKETEDMICRILENKIALLVQQNVESRSLEELLAAVQALMLFHIIQIFDDNIQQNSIAEQNLYTLQSWTIQLRVRAGDLGPALTWQDWTFVESVRRTVIFSMFLESLYSVSKFGYCTNVTALSMLPFTPGASLWHATTSTAWWIESYCTMPGTSLYGDFSHAWENGQILDKLDSFQKLLLTPCLGEKYREMLEIKG